MQKVRYEIDPHNRLVIKDTGRKTRLHAFRRSLDGKFKIGKNNTLTYRVKAPMPRDANIPHQVKLRGKWSLNKRRDLILTLDKWGRQTFGDRLTLTGNIIGVNKDALLFAVSTRTKEGTRSTYCLKLSGSWRADRHNRLTFRVKKERGRHDILILDGIWEIGKNHQIIYRYEKARLIRKSKKIHTLNFKGHWDIKGKARISYVFEGNTGPSFDFRTGAGLFRENYIKYEIGIGLSRRAGPARRIVALFGRWKINRRKELMFEVKYENGKIHAIAFSADIKITDKDTILFRLRANSGRDISANLKLSRSMLGGSAEAFARALKSKRESAVYAGAALEW